MNCTVIIPTWNRPAHLSRILSYYNKYGKGLGIVVADSGSPESRKKNAETIASFKESSILSLNQYSERISNWQKILDAVEHVETEFCVICSDDDFVTTNGIRESITFLSSNPDFTAVYGNHASFSFEYDRDGKPEFTHQYYQGQESTQEKAVDRLLHKATDSSNVSYYSVHRTPFMKVLIGEAARITGELRHEGEFKITPDLFFAELVVLWLPFVQGKMKCLDTLHYVREDCTPSNLKRTYVTLPDLMNDQSYKPKLLEFTECVASHLSNHFGIGPDESRRIVEKAFVIYTRRTPSVVVTINNILNKLHLPGWLDMSIRKAHRVGAALIHPPTGTGHSLPSKYNKELEQVRILVLSSAGEVYGHGN